MPAPDEASAHRNAIDLVLAHLERIQGIDSDGTLRVFKRDITAMRDLTPTQAAEELAKKG